MIRSYFKIALRSLLRNKGFTIINILGLVLGISFSTMLYTYVRHELSYDDYHPHADQIYRVITHDRSNPANVRSYGVTVPPVGTALASTFPEVKEAVRLHRFSGQVIVEVGDVKFNERSYFITSDSNFFTVFKFDFVAGDKTTALSQPMSVVLTATTAKRYFGDENPVNKTVTIARVGTIKVTGVIADPPSNSHLHFDLLFTSIRNPDVWEKYLNSWNRYNAYTYVVLHQGQSITDVERKMPAFVKDHLGNNASGVEISFQAVKDIYLHSEGIELGTESERGQLTYIYIFSTMALFLLIVAAINYINLATSKAATRAKEIGVRKVSGALKSQLIFQFLTEALLTAFFSMMLAIVVMDLCFPFFNSITGKHFDLTLNTLKDFIPSLLTITLIIGGIAGSYPAFYLARLKPTSIIKSQPVFDSNSFNLRTGLVVFQFTITIVLIISTLVIGNQLKFIETKDIGFDKQHLMIIDINSGAVRQQFQTIKNEYAKLPGVQHVAVSSRVPGEWKDIEEIYITAPGNNAQTDSTQMYFMGFDEDMLKTYQFKLKAGHYFTGNVADSMHVLINAAAAKAMNLNNPVGALLQTRTEKGTWRVQVIGVLEDFNFQSLHQKVAPIVIGYQNNPIQSIDYFTLKFAGDLRPLIAQATHVHEQFDHQTPIEYHFLNEQLNSFYVAEVKAGQIFTMGGALSIIVACLGLLGLANYHIARRAKELSIRKILGAGILNLFFMVSFSFLKQVILAFVLACPVAWYIMKHWLANFEFQTLLRADIFILAGLLVLSLAILTVGYQSIRAARSNPVDTLKSE
ncbi:MAG: ABC transporter permease [Bacteroidetes bacterium]|nr:ABC transporter permease [Bacteroidota bacterium]